MNETVTRGKGESIFFAVVMIPKFLQKDIIGNHDKKMQASPCSCYGSCEEMEPCTFCLNNFKEVGNISRFRNCMDKYHEEYIRTCGSMTSIPHDIVVFLHH